MKKTYINPEMEVVKVQTTQMLAASAQEMGLGGDYDEGSGITLGGRDNDNDW